MKAVGDLESAERNSRRQELGEQRRIESPWAGKIEGGWSGSEGL